MIATYETFRDSCLDLSPLGLDSDSSGSHSSVTPANARVLARLIDSPIHFCQIPELGDIICVVNPEADACEQVLPVAKDLSDFIGLLVFCKDAALIAGAHRWSSFRFHELTAAVQTGMKAQSVLRALQNTYHPPVLENPGAMMGQLRKEFDHPPHTSDWKVGMNADFGETNFKGKAGKELTLNKRLSQQEGIWHVPAAYLCDNGIVVDTVLAVPIERLMKFQARWNVDCEDPLSLVNKLQRQLDDPLSASVTGTLLVNDKPLRCKTSFTALWNPLGENSAKVRRILNHYGLDPDQGYLFRRYCFPRKGKYPQIRILELSLEALPVPVPGPVFTAQNAGERFRFTHPGTGLEHTLTVVSVNAEALNPNFLTNHPCFYHRLSYALEPSISPENFRLADRDPGDLWEGYQDDPAAVIYANRRPDPGRYALSSLHYEPRNQVHWQMIFRRKLQKDCLLKLLP